jgi:hypothetical protein
MGTICEEIVKLAGETRTMNSAVQSAQLVSLRIKLEVLHKETVNSSKQVEMLRSLHIPILERRHATISKAAEDSNSWIFEDTATSFMTWLLSEEDQDAFFCFFFLR